MKLPLNWLKTYIQPGLPADVLADKLTMSGSKVESVETVSGEPVIDIEVTTNRPDTLSILGLAREVSALTGKPVLFPKTPVLKPVKGQAGPIRVEISDSKECSFYTARVIEGLRVAASPSDIQARLNSMGSRPISNIVDVTNYVMFETGQPLHAFDLDKLKGGVIQVRKSKPKEKFLAIDGSQHELDGETLVIADAERVIAIAGVIGGKLTEVTDQTQNILLESAYFDPALVRQAGRKYKISTESSYRFERGVDIAGVDAASQRAASLIIKMAGGICTQSVSKGSWKLKTKRITVTAEEITRLLGMSVSAARIKSILTKLGFKVTGSAQRMQIESPSFRRDVTEAADIAEEVLRIVGFDQVPSVTPQTRYADPLIIDAQADGTIALKNSLVAMGLQEVVTYSLISRKTLEDSGFLTDDAMRIVNFVSAEQEYFRPSLMPGLLQSAVFNINRKSASLKLFEIGNCLDKRMNQEKTFLGICFYGLSEENWKRKDKVTFHDLKGTAENVLGILGLRDYEWVSASGNALDTAAAVRSAGQVIGRLGRVNARTRANWDIPQDIFYFELCLDGLFRTGQRAFKVRKLPKYPSVRRDVAFILSAQVPVGDVERVIRSAGGDYLKEIKLFDQFIGKSVGEGRRSLAFSLHYQKEEATFTDEEIQAVQSGVIDALKSQFKAEFRT